ncbi:MAG TPA: DUF433 domain-containing protein [Thermoanaerobaculia bacterium]|nr:DUF433 domain-containing protein [Thermoanaerobaculia bacterium]
MVASPILRGLEEAAMENRSAIHSNPEILSGTPVFVGSRVPFQNMMDYLEAGHTLDEFLDDFPSVSREQALSALEAIEPED